MQNLLSVHIINECNLFDNKLKSMDIKISSWSHSKYPFSIKFFFKICISKENKKIHAINNSSSKFVKIDCKSTERFFRLVR